jgi:hypothetical protein
MKPVTASTQDEQCSESILMAARPFRFTDSGAD